MSTSLMILLLVLTITFWLFDALHISLGDVAKQLNQIAVGRIALV